MAIASMVCGIVGFLSLIICGINVQNSHRQLILLGNDIFSLLIKTQIENRLSIYYVILFISFILIILAFIFGIMTRKKGKEVKYYGMATTGFIIGLIGIILPIIIILFTSLNILIINIMNNSDRNQMRISDPNLSYDDSNQHDNIFMGIGEITANTRDTSPRYTVTIVMNIEHDLNDTITRSELNLRRFELRDFIRRFFNGKFAHELEDVERIKREILNDLNTRYLDNSKARNILFERFEVREIP